MSIGKESFYGCEGFTGKLNIPDKVISIGKRAFAYCYRFTGLELPRSLKSIGTGAFYFCRGFSGSLIIPDSILIEGVAFNGCTGFTSVVLPNSIAPLQNLVFEDCNFTGDLVIPNSWKYIGSNVFEKVTISGNLIIPNSIEVIYPGAFQNFTFTGDLVIPNSVKKIHYRAFVRSNFTGNVFLSDSITTIDNHLFEECKSTGSLYIGNSVNLISSWAFFNSRFTGKLTIPNSVAVIEESAFQACRFTDLIIPSSVKSIGRNAFYLCDSLRTISIGLVVPPPITRDQFSYFTHENCKLIVPTGTIDLYRTLYYWYDFKNISEAIFIFFNSQGGNPVNDLIAYNDTVLSDAPVPVRRGYTFDGWFKEANCMNAWAFSIDSIKTNTTLYAKWHKNICQITFASQKGNNFTTSVNYNTTISEPIEPIRAGFTFLGWYSDTAYVNEWDFSTFKVTSDTTLHAKWQIKKYKVSFNSNGGNLLPDTLIAYSTCVVSPDIPIKTGYTFGGWYKNITCTDPWNFTNDLVTENITLYAKWSNDVNSINTSSIKNIKLYPNPVNDIFYIEGDNLQKATIFNLSGMEVLQINLYKKNAVNISNLYPGCYFLYIETKDSGSMMIKLVKI